MAKPHAKRTFSELGVVMEEKNEDLGTSPQNLPKLGLL